MVGTSPCPSSCIAGLGVTLALLGGFGCLDRHRDTVFIKGSDTMKGLVEAWSADASATPVSFGGGGSSVGVYALFNGLVDIGASSRSLTAKERRIARHKELEVVQIPVAWDGIAIIVHPSNPVAHLTLSQLADVFTSTTVEWTDLVSTPTAARARAGLTAGRITALVRERRSGTHAFFRGHVLNDRGYAATARVVGSSNAVIHAIASDPSAIGYVGLGYARSSRSRVRTVPLLGADGTNAVSPTTDSVARGQYPLTRPLFFYLVTHPSGAVARFIEYVLSPRGQNVVKAAGFVPVRSAGASPLPSANSGRAAAGSD